MKQFKKGEIKSQSRLSSSTASISSSEKMSKSRTLETNSKPELTGFQKIRADTLKLMNDVIGYLSFTDSLEDEKLQKSSDYQAALKFRQGMKHIFVLEKKMKRDTLDVKKERK